MKKYIKYIILILILICTFVIGYNIGLSKNNKKINTNKFEIINTKDAYVKGWSYWFSRYGMHGEGTQYINLYNLGRNYNNEFSNNYDAFVTGYKDGHYYVNHTESSNSNIAEIGYNEYYVKNQNENIPKAVASLMFSSKNSNNTSINESDLYLSNLSGNILSYIRANNNIIDFTNKFGEKVDLINSIDVSSSNSVNTIYKITLYCNNMDNNKCIEALNYINNKIINEMKIDDNQTILVLDKPSILKAE